MVCVFLPVIMPIFFVLRKFFLILNNLLIDYSLSDYVSHLSSFLQNHKSGVGRGRCQLIICQCGNENGIWVLLPPSSKCLTPARPEHPPAGVPREALRRDRDQQERREQGLPDIWGQFPEFAWTLWRWVCEHWKMSFDCLVDQCNQCSFDPQNKSVFLMKKCVFIIGNVLRCV